MGIINLLYARADHWDSQEWVQGDLVAADMRNAATWLKAAELKIARLEAQVTELTTPSPALDEQN